MTPWKLRKASRQVMDAFVQNHENPNIADKPWYIVEVLVDSLGYKATDSYAIFEYLIRKDYLIEHREEATFKSDGETRNLYTRRLNTDKLKEIKRFIRWGGGLDYLFGSLTWVAHNGGKAFLFVLTLAITAFVTGYLQESGKNLQKNLPLNSMLEEPKDQ